MKKKKREFGKLFLVVGILVLIYCYSSSIVEPERTLRPSYDGYTNDFKLTLNEKSATAEEGDLYSTKINIANVGDNSGGMWVQCSLLQKTTWMNDLMSITKLNIDNCVTGEEFTQTAHIGLSTGQNADVTFSFKVPELAGKDTYLWCEAFEQCYSSTTQDTYRSGYILEPVTIIPSDNKDDNNNYIEPGTACSIDTDCKKWWSFSSQVCLNGYCVDDEDVPENPNNGIEWPDLTDDKFKEWYEEHQVLLVFLGMILAIVGLVWIYGKEPQ